MVKTTAMTYSMTISNWSLLLYARLLGAPGEGQDEGIRIIALSVPLSLALSRRERGCDLTGLK
jgi:hypothetical protein